MLGLSLIMQKFCVALIRRNLIFNGLTWIKQVKSEEKVNPQIAIRNEASGPAKHFHSLYEKWFRQKRFLDIVKKFLLIIPLAVHNPLVFRDGSVKVVGKVRFVRKLSIWIVNLLFVDAKNNLGKNWVQNVVYMSNERNWNLLLLLLLLFHIHFNFFFVLRFHFFANIGFVAPNLDKFQLKNQVRLSQINVLLPMRLKFKLCVAFINWGSRVDLLFLGRQDIVNYWDFTSKFSRNCYRTLVPKITRHD